MATPAQAKLTIVPTRDVPISTPLAMTLPVLRLTGGIVEVAGRFVPNSYIQPTPQFGSEPFFNHIDAIHLRPIPLPGPVPTAEKHFRLFEDYSDALEALMNIAGSEEARGSSIAKDLPFLKERYGAFRGHVERRRARRDEERKKARLASYKPKDNEPKPIA